MKQRITIIDIARLAGVSPSSVSRVINGHPDVGLEMRQKVLEVIERHNWERNQAASRLRSGSSRIVGFVVQDISNPLYSRIAHGASGVLAEAGYSFSLIDAATPGLTQSQHLATLRSHSPDGLILSHSHESDPETMTELRRLECPIVLVDRDLPEDLADGQVLVDHRRGMADAIRHLHGLGHSRIGIVLGPRGLRPIEERLAAYTTTMDELGLTASPDLIQIGAFDPEFGGQATRVLLTLREPATAIIAANNQLAEGVVGALQVMAGGDAIALVACDDTALTRLSQPPIAVINRDIEEMGRQAANMLLALIKGQEHYPRTFTLPTTYEPRGSAQKPPV